jgi:aquaporin Z
MKKYFAELVGTFSLVLIGTGSMVLNEVYENVSHLAISISWGGIVTAMIYIFGKTSGAHINPAVSISFSMTNTFNKKFLLQYLLAQITGALLASLLLILLFPSSKILGATLPSGSWQQSFAIEFFMTFILMWVILIVSQNSKLKKYIALAAGTVVGLEAFFGGPITGASMNPARSIAPAIISGNTQHLWLYIVATILGALLATFIWLQLKKKN